MISGSYELVIMRSCMITHQNCCIHDAHTEISAQSSQRASEINRQWTQFYLLLLILENKIRYDSCKSFAVNRFLKVILSSNRLLEET